MTISGFNSNSISNSLRLGSPQFGGRLNAKKKAEQKALGVGGSVAIGASGASAITTVSGGGPAAFALAIREIMPFARLLFPMTTIGGSGYMAYQSLKPESDKRGDIQPDFDPKEARTQLQETIKELKEDEANILAGDQKVNAMVAEEQRRLNALKAQETKLLKDIQDFTQNPSNDSQGERASQLKLDQELLKERIKSQEEFLGTCQAHQNQRTGKGKEILTAIKIKIQKFEDLLNQLERMEKLAQMTDTLQEQSEEHLGAESNSTQEMIALRAKIEAEFQAHLSTAKDAKLESEVQEALRLQTEQDAREVLQKAVSEKASNS